MGTNIRKRDGGVSPRWIEAAQRIRRLRKEEESFGWLERAAKTERLIRRYWIGWTIEQALPATYGSSAVARFAAFCGMAQSTAYEYINFRRGAVYDFVIRMNPLPSWYYQTLGATLLGLKARQNVVRKIGALFLLFRPVADETRIRDVNRLVVAAERDIRGRLGAADLLDNRLKFEVKTSPGHLALTVQFPRPDNPQQRNVVFAVLERYGLFINQMFTVCGCSRADADRFANINVRTRRIDLSPFTGSGAQAVLRASEMLWELERSGASPAVHCRMEIERKVFQGDSRVMLAKPDLFPPESISTVLTDPPYSKAVYKAYRMRNLVPHDAEATPERQAEVVSGVARALIENKVVTKQFIWLSFCPSDWVHVFLPPLLDAFGKSGRVFHQVLTWDKRTTPPVGGTECFSRQVESILYINVNNRRLLALASDEGKKVMLHPSLLSYPFAKGEELFWKPINLLRHLIEITTKRDDIVLDPFCGRGGVALAAIDCGRDFRLVDSHKGQWELAQKIVAKRLAERDHNLKRERRK